MKGEEVDSKSLNEWRGEKREKREENIPRREKNLKTVYCLWQV